MNVRRIALLAAMAAAVFVTGPASAAEISGAGDVAWLATPGTVTFWETPRSLRFTATLVHEDGRWLFRQIQFQWEANRTASLRELIWPGNLMRLRWL